MIRDYVTNDSMPNYLNDLNAMHEAEKMLTRPEGWVFVHEHLTRIVDRDNGKETAWFPVVSATAVQRAEAFLRTIGKWEDQPRQSPPGEAVYALPCNTGCTGSHFYPGCEGKPFQTTDCKYGCGCWMGSCRSGGPDGIDPHGECPNNPKLPAPAPQPAPEVPEGAAEIIAAGEELDSLAFGWMAGWPIHSGIREIRERWREAVERYTVNPSDGERKIPAGWGLVTGPLEKWIDGAMFWNGSRWRMNGRGAHYVPGGEPIIIPIESEVPEGREG